MGIVREDGRVATRNYIGILSTVNCSATVVAQDRRVVHAERLAEFPNVDGVVAFSHDRLRHGDDRRADGPAAPHASAGYCRHANLPAALVVGLGCERNQINDLLEAREAGRRAAAAHLRDAGDRRHAQDHRGRRRRGEGDAAGGEPVSAQPVPASHITVGLQCGGSDGFSSITANPALGAAMDILVRHGGTAILSETPEIYGVEHTLTRRAREPAKSARS